MRDKIFAFLDFAVVVAVSVDPVVAFVGLVCLGPCFGPDCFDFAVAVGV